MPGGLRQALPATRKSTRVCVLEYLLAVSCAGLCQRCNCRVDACPLSDLVVVNFPDYAGPRCFDNLPNTWVPVHCVEVAHMNAKAGIVRAWVPLRLASVLTIHKSQGITAREGCVVSFAGVRSLVLR